MSAEYQGQDPLEIARQAERDLNSQEAKGNTVGRGVSDSVNESGIDASAADKFPGGEVRYGSEASGQGDKREIPLDEGGSIDPDTGKMSKAGDFEGPGGPEDKARLYAETNPGDDSVRENIRQGGETIRPGGGDSNNARDGTGGRTE